MVEIKTREEVEKIRKSGKILRFVLDLVKDRIKPGVTTGELSRLAEEHILAEGAVPAFKGYRGFPQALCISINDELIHGIPGDRLIMEGDIVKVDGGVLFNGWFSDSAFTVIAGKPLCDDDARLVRITEKALEIGIATAKEGNTIGDIGHYIQSLVESSGFSVVRDYSGHGLGRRLHEDPSVPNFGTKGKGITLKEGMVIAIEPMVTSGSYELFVGKDGWTVRTVDGSKTAHFEHTVAITCNGPEVLTL